MIAMDCAPQIHVAAYHAKAQDQYGNDYNGDTPGIGVLCPIANNTRFAAGTYFNSFRRQSNYAAVVWQPFDIGGVKVGVLAGAVSGYKSYAIPLAAAAATLPVGQFELHLTLIPEANTSPATAEFSFSFKFK